MATAIGQQVQSVSVEVGTDLTSAQFRGVKMDASNNNRVVAIAAITDVVFGILQEDVDGSSDVKSAEVQVGGIAKMEASAAITRGDLVGVSANGRAVAIVAGTDTTQFTVGIALQTAAGAGEIISVLIQWQGRAA